MLELSLVQKRRLLRNSVLLAQIDDSDADALLADAHITRYPAGTEIFAKGDPGDSMMAVARGRVRISAASAEGRQIVLNMIGEGEIFGEIALLDGRERTADATTMTDCELLTVRRRSLLPILRRRPELCIALLVLLCDRLRRTSEQVEDVFFRSLEARLAKLLLRLAEERGERTSGALRFDLKLSQRELGEIVGATRESINKHLQLWHRAGIIDFEKGAIVIHDPHALEAYG